MIQICQLHYVVRANIKSQFDFDFIVEQKDLEHALQLNPNSEFAYSRLSGLLSGLDLHDQALSQAHKAVSLNPMSPYTN